MKIITVIARFFLGLIFLVFGLNGFLHFIPSSPPSGTAGQFENGRLAEHWDVLQDEATKAQSKSGLPMFGEEFQ